MAWWVLGDKRKEILRRFHNRKKENSKDRSKRYKADLIILSNRTNCSSAIFTYQYTKILLLESSPPSNCKNENKHCDYWARTGECQKNPGYMLVKCKKACNVCGSNAGK